MSSKNEFGDEVGRVVCESSYRVRPEAGRRSIWHHFWGLR